MKHVNNFNEFVNEGVFNKKQEIGRKEFSETHSEYKSKTISEYNKILKAFELPTENYFSADVYDNNILLDKILYKLKNNEYKVLNNNVYINDIKLGMNEEAGDNDNLYCNDILIHNENFKTKIIYRKLNDILNNNSKPNFYGDNRIKTISEYNKILKAFGLPTENYYSADIFNNDELLNYILNKLKNDDYKVLNNNVYINDILLKINEDDSDGKDYLYCNGILVSEENNKTKLIDKKIRSIIYSKINNR